MQTSTWPGAKPLHVALAQNKQERQRRARQAARGRLANGSVCSDRVSHGCSCCVLRHAITLMRRCPAPRASCKLALCSVHSLDVSLLLEPDVLPLIVPCSHPRRCSSACAAHPGRG